MAGLQREETGTLLSFRPSIRVIDATMRDGGLVNNFQFSDQFVTSLYQANIASGVDYMEMGYKADKDLFDESAFGKWKFCKEDDIFRIVGENKTPLKLAVMADVGRCNVERDLGDKKNSPIDMVRIATYINTIPAALAMVDWCEKKGYETTVNVMAISQASEKEIDLALEMLGKSATRTIYIVDSYGSMYPEEMRVIGEKYMEAGVKYGKQIGIHAHNNQNLAFANTIECTALGVNYLDATVQGMGRGAGNCAMELLLGFLKNPKYKLVHMLKFIEKHMPEIRKSGAVWGYDLPYLLTGVFNRHPSPAIRYIKDKRENIVDFYHEILDQE
ncbi:MAG: aldolase catalytic domain-containing protein [Clostridia bacterium]|nr:aldolase catalytic domain-containing protein [Clostridia bacterium]